MAEEKAIAKLTKEKIDLNAQMQVMQSKMKAMEIELKEAKAKVVDEIAARDGGRRRRRQGPRGEPRPRAQTCTHAMHSFFFIHCLRLHARPLHGHCVAARLH